ncbi:NAD(P)-binding protein [Hypoxylon rubiginosum]|uniref:NAD(P)-binding protein n=1 Tax=Hypoxylon rubiginosum TaxID=110542 RepID=A0ACC0CP88_9PEZI|nr:NAD(P)-binding protein [Hypoxylon rubiginosum]
MGASWSQFFPPAPSLTGSNLEPQDGKVFLVTGGYGGIGFELVKLLYGAHGRIYIAGRSADKAKKAIEEIRASAPSSRGALEFLQLDLGDLNSIKEAVQVFKTQESKLHVLWNNAGVSWPPLGSVSKQGTELQLATNCIGPFFLTQLLLPLLEKAAADSPAASVRVVWASSQIVDLQPPPGGIDIDAVRTPPKDRGLNYINSKVGNCLLSSELARRVGPSHGIVSVAQNPGGSATNLFRDNPWMKYLAYPLLHHPRKNAHTELYAGLSPDITIEKNGCYVVPFGRIAQDADIDKDRLVAMKAEEDGGSGKAREFWEFCEEKTRDYY